MEAQWLASSILQPQTSGLSTTTDTPLPVRQKRSRDSYLYDHKGQRLKGLKGEAAKLMHNHRFFSSEEELHHLEQALASAKRSAAASSTDYGGAGCDSGLTLHKLPALPDMFGVVQSPVACSGAPDAVSGEVASQKAMIPPTHRWLLVRRRHATVGQTLSSSGGCDGIGHVAPPRPSTSGHRWIRADALHVEDLLMSALLLSGEESGGEGNPSGAGGGCWGGDFSGLQLSHILSAPPDVEFSVFQTSKGPSPFAFFTVSYEEYAALQLDDDMYQPLVLSSSNNNNSSSIETVPWRFDFNSTCKLLTLYERFGNFVVVADRWRYVNSYDVEPSLTTMVIEGNSISAVTPTPPVEVLMERYRLVSEAVMRHRLCLLREALKNKTVASETSSLPSSPLKEKCYTSAAKSGQAGELRMTASTYPLTSLMEKHPILSTQKKREEWLMDRYKELCQGDGSRTVHVYRNEREEERKQKENEEEVHEKKILERNREEFLRQCTEYAAAQAARSASGNEVEASLLASCSLPPAAPPFWYDGILEQARRGQLREFLLHEARINVPYIRAVVALKRLNSQATVLFEKLRVLMHNGTSFPQDDEYQARPTNSVENAEKKIKNPKRNTAGKRGKQQQQQQQANDTQGEDSYHGVQEEVRRIPLQCERLKLSVQAGWFLPTTSGGVSERPSGSNMVANRAFSNIAEALLLTLPPTVPRVHLGVEHELEKHLWEDHRALCDDSAEVQQLLSDVRVVYTQNVILRRFAGRCGTLEASLKKLVTEATAMDT